MSVLEEFRRTGEVGDELAEMTYRAIRAVARIYNFPPPAGMDWRDEDTVWTAVSKFFAEYDGKARLVTLCVQSENDSHLYAQLETTVRRWFQTLARRSERGRLIRALQRVLDDDNRFVEVSPGDFWALDGPHVNPTTIHLEELVAAAWEVDFQVVRARPDAKKRSPWATREDQVRVLSAILERAEGAVEINDIAQVISARVGLLDAPTHIELDETDPDVVGVDDENIDTTDARSRALLVFNQLGDKERKVLAYRDEPVREAAAELGMASSTFHDAKKRVDAALELVLSPDDVDVMRYLYELADEYVAERTDPTGSASS